MLPAGQHPQLDYGSTTGTGQEMRARATRGHHAAAWALILVTWGGQANPVWPLLDVMPQIAAIQTGTWDAQTINELAAMRDLALGDLNSRLGAMSDGVEQMTTEIDALN